jgi:hypothetical protein
MSAAAPTVAELNAQGIGQLGAAPPNPQTTPGGLNNPSVNTPGGTDYVAQVDTTPMFQLAPSQVLPTNMTFPQAYSGPEADAQYMADEAALRYNIAKQYSDLLNQLGYVDPQTGATIQGQIAQKSNIQGAQYQHDLAQEAIDNDRTMQNNGTIFSGVRGTELAKLQYPTENQLGGLQLDTATQMQQAYQNAQDLINQYSLQNNQLIGQAAQRYLQNMLQQQSFATPPSGGTSGGGTGTPSGQISSTQGATSASPIQTPQAIMTPPASTPNLQAIANQGFASAGGGGPGESAPITSSEGQAVPIGGLGVKLAAEGAVVTKPTLTVTGENNRPEVIVPLDKLKPRSQIALLRLADEAGIYTETVKRMANIG